MWGACFGCGRMTNERAQECAPEVPKARSCGRRRFRIARDRGRSREEPWHARGSTAWPTRSSASDLEPPARRRRIEALDTWCQYRHHTSWHRSRKRWRSSSVNLPTPSSTTCSASACTSSAPRGSGARATRFSGRRGPAIRASISRTTRARRNRIKSARCWRQLPS